MAGREPSGDSGPPPDAPIFTEINHVCIVTRDLDRLVRTWADRYAVKPWSVYRFEKGDISAAVDGSPAEFGIRAALCNVGPDAHGRFEIIEPLDDASPYARALEARGDRDHVHHVRLDVAGFDDAEERLPEVAGGKLLDGRFSGRDPAIRSTAVYLDTEDELGVTIEISGLPPGFEMPEPEYVYPVP